jgi:hypothetical protein
MLGSYQIVLNFAFQSTANKTKRRGWYEYVYVLVNSSVTNVKFSLFGRIKRIQLIWQH